MTTFPSSLADVIDASARVVARSSASVELRVTPFRNGLGEGDILLGGAGSDTITGRGDDDIIDGDHALSVRISVRANPDGTGAEIASTDLMEHPALSGSFFAGSTATTTLQQAVFAGKVDPGQLVPVREILGTSNEPMGTTPRVSTVGDCPFAAGSTTTTLPASSVNCDTALYTGEIVDPANIAASYSVTLNGDGSVTVADLASVAAGPPFPKGDGIADTLWNIENLRFCTAIDANKNCSAFVNLPSPGAVAAAAPAVSLSATSLALATTAVRSVSAPQTITVTNSGTAPLIITGTPLSGTNAADFTATGCVGTVAPAATCTISVTFAPLTTTGAKTATLTINSNAPGAAKTVTLTGTAGPDVTAPTVTAQTPAAGATLVGLTAPITATFSEPLNPTFATAANATLRVGATVINAPVSFNAATNVLTLAPTAPLTPDTTYTVRLLGTIRDLAGNRLVAVTWSFTTIGVPKAPTAVTAVRGNAQATVSWTQGSDGGSPITGYVITVRTGATVVRTVTLPGTGPLTSTIITGLTNGTAYNFRVQAVNIFGTGAISAASAPVTPATVPNAPTIGLATQGAAGGALTAVATWAAGTGNGGSAINSWTVTAFDAAGNVVVPTGTAGTNAAGTVQRTFTFSSATPVRFKVIANNALGAGPSSDFSNQVTPR